MKKDSFFRDSLTLTLSNLTTGVLGFMFSIILSRELGAEGLGLYGLVMPIYNLFICLICGGMVTAISKVAAVYFEKKDFKNLNKTIDTASAFDLLWGLLVASFVFLLAPYISSTIIKDPRTLNSVRIICPAMIFVALSSILKGYFYGTSKIKVPAFIDILEKGIRIAVIVSIVTTLSLTDTTSTVTAAYIALCVGEFISLVLLYIYYKLSKRERVFRSGLLRSEGRAQLLFDVLVVSFPLCLNGFLSTALSTVSTLIVPRRLVGCGIEYGTALSMIGKFTGMSLSIIYFPIIVISSMSIVLIPDLSQTMNKKDYFALEERIMQVLKISFLLGICTAAISFSLPNSLGKLFFGRTDLGSYIKFLAATPPLVYLTVSTFGILNGLGKQKIILRNSLIVSALELILLYILTGISSINIYGYGITIAITSITTLIMNLYEIKKHCYIQIPVADTTVYILLGVLLYFILTFLNNQIPNTIFVIKNILLITLGFSLFFLSITILNKKSQ